MNKNEIIKQIEQQGIEVPELGIKIIPKQMFNGKLYSEITDEVDRKFIAPYETLQKLRNIAFESGWEKYSFMKSFWVFVPNPDKVSKANGYFARFGVVSDSASLICDGDPSDMNAYLGVFFYCPITARKK